MPSFTDVLVSPADHERVVELMRTTVPTGTPVRITADPNIPTGSIYTIPATGNYQVNGVWQRAGDTVDVTYTVPVSGRYNTVAYHGSGTVDPRRTEDTVVFYSSPSRHFKVAKAYALHKGALQEAQYIFDELGMVHYIDNLKGTYRIKKPVKSRLPEGL